MNNSNDPLYNLRFPIGEYQKPSEVNDKLWQHFIDDIEQLPMLLENATQNLNDEQLDLPYRPQGWTSRQVVHHLADSHLNMYVRLKLALTEDNPNIKPYLEASWANLPDYKLPIAVSINLLKGLHTRWTYLLRSLSPEDRKRGYYHPEYGKIYTIDHITGFYAWHGKHHLAHITKQK